jgi:uncharacterized membrane protein YphA (DoxX/SURF4 family)
VFSAKAEVLKPLLKRIAMKTATEHQINTGLLLIRCGLAATLLFYALPRLLDGSAAWSAVGRDMRFLPADVSYAIVGGIVLLIDVLASVGLVTGFMFRLSSIGLACVYGLYFFNFINVGYKTLPLYAAALACVCLGLVLIGPGRFAVAVKIEKK